MAGSLTARGKSRHGIRPSLHPGGLRCYRLTYSRYAPSEAPCPAGAETVSVLARLSPRTVNVYMPQPEDPRSVRTALDVWYRAHALPIFRNRMDRCVESAPSLSGLCPDLRIRRMSKLWGSCSRKGTITLSLDLIKTPLHCIEYVITHELCHLLVHDHSPAFFRMLSRCMPDWERRKARLEEVVLR